MRWGYEMMKAWQVKQPGSIDTLGFENTEDPSAKEKQLTIKIHSTALNPVDFQIIENGHPDWNYPHIPGVDLAGEIIEVGPNVDGFMVGERIACHSDLRTDGAFSGQLAYVSRKPDVSGVKGFTLAPSIHEIALGAAHNRGAQDPIKNLAFMAKELMERIQKGSLDPMIKEVLPRMKLPKGLEELKTGHVQGKIIVRMQEE